jgi:hypothetical protein
MIPLFSPDLALPVTKHKTASSQFSAGGFLKLNRTKPSGGALEKL